MKNREELFLLNTQMEVEVSKGEASTWIAYYGSPWITYTERICGIISAKMRVS
jgi:hypothetical protein